MKYNHPYQNLFKSKNLIKLNWRTQKLNYFWMFSLHSHYIKFML